MFRSCRSAAKSRVGSRRPRSSWSCLVADLQELKANPKRTAIGTIVEARHGQGAAVRSATVLVQTGTLKVGDIIVVGATFGRVRALYDEHGKRIKKAGPATPALILGLPEVPEAGDILRVVSDEKSARAAVETRTAELAAKGGEGGGRATLEDLYRQIQAGQAKELRIVLKADVSGSLGAITHALGQLKTDEVKLNVLYEGAGEISDNDIMLAAASNAVVVGFNTAISDTARRAAEAEKVDVRLYDIIYQLTDDIEKALSGLLEPELVEVVEGRAEVRKLIKVGRQVIAGSYVTDGRIVRAGGVRLWRGGKVIVTDKIDSLRRFKDYVREVQTGFECGIGLVNTTDILEGDVIECYTTQSVSRSRSPPAQWVGVFDAAARIGLTSCCARRSAPSSRRDVPGPAHRDRDRSPTSRRHRTCSTAPRLGQRDRPAGRARPHHEGAPSTRLPFVRHELGSRIRLRAHPRAPAPRRRHRPSAEPGSCSSLPELEAGGVVVDPTADADESLPTPMPARSTAGARGAEGKRKPGPRAVRLDEHRSPARGSTPCLTRRVPARSPVHVMPLVATPTAPTRTRSGAALGDRRDRRAPRRAGDAGLRTDPVPPLYGFLAGMDRFVPDPAPDARLRSASSCATAAPLDRLGGSASGIANCSIGCPGVLVDHHASNTDGGASDWVDPGAAATCEMVALLAAKLGVPLDADGGSMAAGTHGGHRHGHLNVCSPERNAPHPPRSRRRSSPPARRSRRSPAACTAPSRTRSCGSSAECWTASTWPAAAPHHPQLPRRGRPHGDQHDLAHTRRA